MGIVYVHYGSKHFDPLRFMPIKNKELGTKPEGGLWASPLGCKYGWKEWNDNSKFSDCNDDNSFQFTLKDNTKILQINSIDDLVTLPKASSIIPAPSFWTILDYEKLVENGVDAIQVNMSNDISADITNGLYFQLYGWDCDSMLIMNKEVILI